VKCINAAVGDGNSVPCTGIVMDHENNMGGAGLLEMAAVTENRIPTVKINYPFHFMKVDVEGMEVEVLKGARESIIEYQPVLYVENDRKARSDELINLINSFGYKCYWHLAPLYNKDNYNKREENIFEDMVSVNMICIPSFVEFYELKEAKPGQEWDKVFLGQEELDHVA
jgi:Methyltransferase FkbM domain